MTALEAPPGKCPVAPVREAFERSGKSLTEVAAAMDWRKANGNPDAGRVSRALGMRNTGTRPGHHSRSRRDGEPQQTMRSVTASKLCEAIGVMPVEIGL